MDINQEQSYTMDLLNAMLSRAKTEKRLLLDMKNLAIKCQQFELGAKLRDLEKELFPETKEVIEAKKKGEQLNLLFRMVGISVEESICWLLSETLKVYGKKKGKFSVRDAAKLRADHQRIFKNVQ